MRKTNKNNGSSKRLRNIFNHMIDRTTNRARYVERDIKIEFTSFEEFRDWSLENGYDDGLSIDRIDNNGNYSMANCRWADAATQAQNRSTTKLTKAAVLFIRELANSNVKVKVIAKIFMISEAHAYKIISRQRWSNV